MAASRRAGTIRSASCIAASITRRSRSEDDSGCHRWFRQRERGARLRRRAVQGDRGHARGALGQAATPRGSRWWGPPVLEVESELGAEHIAQTAADEARAAGVRAKAHVQHGDPAESIAAAGVELGADLIVVGTRGLGPVSAALLGSVSHGLIKQSRIPVTVCAHARTRTPDRRLAGLAGALAAARPAFSRARPGGARAHSAPGRHASEPQLGEDVPAMRLDGAHAQEQPLGDLLVRVAERDQPQHVALALGEIVLGLAPSPGGPPSPAARTAGRRAPPAARRRAPRRPHP